MNLLLDCPTMEWWLDEYHRGGTILSAFAPAYLWAVTGYRVAGAQPYCMSRGNPYDQTSFPPEELMAEGMLALTNGIRCPLYFGYFTDASTKLMKEMGRRAKWTVRAEPMTYASLLFSDNTRTYYGVDRIEDRFLPPYLWFLSAPLPRGILR